jgi:cyanate permease
VTDPSPAGTETGPEAVDRVQWRIAALGVAVIAITILPAFMTGALSTRINEDAGLDLTAIGGLYGVLFGTSALASAPAGRAVQRLGWQTGIRVSSAATGGSLVAMATFPDAWWAAWWPIALLFVLAGIAAATSQVASNQALVRSVPAGRYGLLFGLKHTSVPVAAMLGGLAVPALALTIGWRTAFGAAAVLAAATMAAVPLQRDRAGAIADRQDGRRGTSTPLSVLVALAAAAFLGHAGIDALGAFVVPYAVSVGVAEGLAGVLLTTGSFAGLCTRLLAGWLVDRRQHAGLAWIAALLLGGSLGFLVLSVGGRPLLVAGILLAFGGGWGWAGLLTFVVVRADPAAAATATGIANTGKYVGAGLGPVLFGLLAEGVSFAAAWGVASVLLLAGGLLVAAIRLSRAGRAMADPPPRRTL